MEAGRELDVLVAEKVMGLTIERLGVHRDYECGGWLICSDCEFGIDPDVQRLGAPIHEHAGEQPCYRDERVAYVVPEFSTEIAAAWKIVTLMRERGFTLHLSEWQCLQGPCIEVSFDPPPDEYRPRGVAVLADTAPLAICKAALAALGAQVPA